jgi:hypothetical protein
VDEYGEEHSLPELVALVDAKRDARNKHATYMAEHYPPGTSDDWLDEEGHSFSGGDFS